MGYDRLSSPLYMLLMTGRQLKLPKGQVVHGFGGADSVHLIKSGYIKRYLITKDGSQSIQIIYGPGDIFPLLPVRRALFKDDGYSTGEQYYHEAMTPLEIVSISLDSLTRALEENPLIYRDLFYAASVRIDSNVFRLENMSLRVTNLKLAHLLVHLAEHFGEPTEEGIKILVPLTQQNLASYLNIARETVTLTLARLEEKSLIKAAGKQITVLDADGLKHIFK